MPNFMQLLSLVRSDFRAGIRFSAAKIRASALARENKASAKAMLEAYREIGRGASGTKEATQRKSFGAMKTNEDAAAEKEAALAQREAEAGATKARLAERTAFHQQVIAMLESVLAPLVAARRDAQSALDAVNVEIKEMEKRLAIPPEKEAGLMPREEATQRLEAAKGRLPAAEQAAGAARALEEAKATEIRAAKEAQKQEQAQIGQELKQRETVVKEAEKEVAAAKAQLDKSLEDLGQSMYVAGAGANLEALIGPVKKTTELKEKIQKNEQEIQELKVISDATKKQAVRALLYSLGIAAVLGGGTIVLAAVL